MITTIAVLFFSFNIHNIIGPLNWPLGLDRRPTALKITLGLAHIRIFIEAGLFIVFLDLTLGEDLVSGLDLSGNGLGSSQRNIPILTQGRPIGHGHDAGHGWLPRRAVINELHYMLGIRKMTGSP